VNELATDSIRTIEVLMVLFAELGLIVLRHVLLFLDLPQTVCERALYRHFILSRSPHILFGNTYRLVELAVSIQLPVPAHLGLVLYHKAYSRYLKNLFTLAFILLAYLSVDLFLWGSGRILVLLVIKILSVLLNIREEAPAHSFITDSVI
jgi:hypothetical protein